MAAGSLLVCVYTDDKVLSIEHHCPLSAEDICKECLSQLKIDFIYIHLFSLYDIVNKLWLSPNHLFIPSSNLEKDVRYMFRIRFQPKISIKDEKFLSYLHLHYRYSYTKEFLVGNINFSILYGLSILDVVINSYEKKESISRIIFQGNRYKMFFSEQMLKEYNYFQKILLKWRLKKRSERQYEKSKNYRINNMKTTYIDLLKKHFSAYINKESYEYRNKNETKMVVTIEEKDSEIMICFQDENYSLASVRLVKIQNGFVEIYFKGSSLKVLKMKPDVAESFVSCIDVLYRLVYNYHFGICDNVFSPRIKELHKLGCYDYINEETVVNILQNHDQKGSYLLRMRLNSMDVFDVFTLNYENKDVQKFAVGPNKDCQYDSINSLLKAQEYLLHKIKPSHFERCNLLFCHMPIKLGHMFSINPQLKNVNVVYQSSEITFSEKIQFHSGIFTDMHKAKLEGSKMLVSIKTLKKFPGYAHYVQLFMKEVDNMLEMCKCPQFLQIKGITLGPNFGLITELPLCSAANYLSNKELPLIRILKMALTVAEGLEFLRKQGIVHGDINCQNLQMIDQELVRITDPSIVSKVYLLPVDNKIYQSQLPWIDPWLKNSFQPTFQSDIFSYGTMLCEMLCFHQKPPQPIDKKVTNVFPCRLLFDVSQDQDKAEMASYVQKELSMLIIKCRLSKVEDRPQPQDIATKLEELIHEAIILPTKYDSNVLCNHKWQRLCINLQELSKTIKIIQEKSQEVKIQKPVAPHIIDEKLIEREVEIGNGAFGVVYRGKYCGTPVAIKTIKNLEDLESTRAEVKILQQLNHVRIVKFLGICNEREFVLEFVSGGDLHTRLIKNKNILIKDLIQILYEIAEGMEYLQENVVIHRDLAARNILLTDDNHVKITDFGLSKKILEGDDYKIHSNRAMPFLWSAPERNVISSKSDVWSFGVVMWECYSCGKKPELSPNMKPQDHLPALQKGRRLPRPSQCPQAKYKIMEECWQYEQKLRPDFTYLKEKFL